MWLICNCSPPPSLSDFSDVAQVIIATVNIIFVWYFFTVQTEQNTKSDDNTAKLNEQNIRLQWFKELIIQPKLGHLNDFFSNLENIKAMIHTVTMNDDEIIALNKFINSEASKFRVNFYDVMLNVNNEMYRQIKKESEDLVTKLTTTISDGNFNLTDNKIFEKEILDHIRYAKHNIISMIFKYKGL